MHLRETILLIYLGIIYIKQCFIGTNINISLQTTLFLYCFVLVTEFHFQTQVYLSFYIPPPTSAIKKILLPKISESKITLINQSILKKKTSQKIIFSFKINNNKTEAE